MTKAQTIAADFIDNYLRDPQEPLHWDQISDHVKAEGGRVKNWMTIRSVLQWFINEGHLKRDHGKTDAANGIFDVEALRVERYIPA